VNCAERKRSAHDEQPEKSSGHEGRHGPAGPSPFAPPSSPLLS